MRAAATLFAIMLAACQPKMQDVSRDSFEPNKIAYFKDGRTGICFAVIAYQRWDTAGRIAAGMSHTAVPCVPEVERLAGSVQP